jgi:hypothetical protein
MDKIKIELRFDDKTEVKSLNVYYCEFEQLMHNKEIISDGNEYQITKSTAVNVGDDLWYSFDCKLNEGLRSQSTVKK